MSSSRLRNLIITIIVIAVAGLVISHLPFKWLLKGFNEYGYPLLFLGTFLEGETILLVGSFLAYLGYFNLFWVMIIASCGIILGDQVAYFIGQRWGKAIFKTRDQFLHLRREHLEKLNGHFNQRGNKLILISRFLFGMRLAIIMAAGMARMDYGKFLKFNALSGIVWVIVISSLGYIFGSSFSFLKLAFRNTALVITALVILAILLEFFWGQKIREKISKYLNFGKNAEVEKSQTVKIPNLKSQIPK